MVRVEQLVTELRVAHYEAQKDVLETPPGVRSVLLEVKPLLGRLITDGRRLAADLHAAAHDRGLLLDAHNVRDWESTAERVLRELLMALELSGRVDET